MNFEKVKYKLVNNDTKTSVWLENDPKNWDKSERTLKRSTKTFGVYTELSKNLEFVLDGADFLKEAYTFKGGEADVTLFEYRFNPSTSHPYLHSTGTFDFSKYKATDLDVKLPFKTGGLNALIKSQTKEKFEIERLESINGKVIDAIDKKTVSLTSRDIFLVSKWDSDNSNTNTGENGDKNTYTAVTSNDGNTRGVLSSLPLRIVDNSHETWAQYTFPSSIGDGGGSGNANGSSLNMFFLNADRQRTLNISLDYDFKAYFQRYEQVGWCYYALSLVTYQNGTNLDFKERTTLHQVKTANTGGLTSIVSQDVMNGDFSGSTQYTIPISGSYATTVTLQEGESLAFEIWLRSDLQVSNTADVGVYAQDSKNKLTITEDSFFDDSQAQAVLLKDAYEKVMQIITGEKGRFYSDFYQNGNFKLTALTTGFWIRQFNYIIETIEGKEVPKYAMQISLDNLLNTSNAIHNTGYHIETIKGKETLVVEDLKYYFQQGTAIRLGEVSDLEEENADDFCHSSLSFGYKKGGDYEEAMGLDEYNIKTGFTTPLKRVDTKYTKISDARADAYAKEFARRKPKLTHGTTDTPYDKDLHLLDLKTGLGTALEERIYTDDFEELPKGVYSPETATNLRLTPSQIEKRHEWFYGSGVIKHQDDKIRYSNTEGNNSLSTKEVGKLARSERDDINISDLEKARFESIWYTFQHPLNYEVTQQLNGKTNVNGRDIPNVYFKVEFTYKGQSGKGYLFQVQQKKTDLGEFKLLKAV